MEDKKKEPIRYSQKYFNDKANPKQEEVRPIPATKKKNKYAGFSKIIK